MDHEHQAHLAGKPLLYSKQIVTVTVDRITPMCLSVSPMMGH